MTFLHPWMKSTYGTLSIDEISPSMDGFSIHQNFGKIVCIMDESTICGYHPWMERGHP